MSEPLRVVASRYCLEFHRCSPPNGQCVQQGRAEFCRCRTGFQGVDCAEASISSPISPPAVAPGSTPRDINAHYKPSRHTPPPYFSSQHPGLRINHTLREYTIPVSNDSLAMREYTPPLVQQRLPPPPYFHATSTLLPPVEPKSGVGENAFAIGGALVLSFIVGGTLVLVWKFLKKFFDAVTVPGAPAVLPQKPVKKEEGKKEENNEEEKEKKEEEEPEKMALITDPIAVSKAQWTL